MPKQDIIPGTETVQEIGNKYEVPSYEEFIKNYEIDEGVVDSYNSEVESYKDIRIGKISGPMPYGSEGLGDFPTIAELFNYNRRGTINFLKEKGALQAYEATHNLNFYCESSSSDKAWGDYRREIEMYLDQLTRQFSGSNGEILRQFKKELADYIHSNHYQQFPNWSSVGCENEANISLNAEGSYKCMSDFVQWSCVGWITVKNRRSNYDTFRVEFSGVPEVKLLIYDSYRLSRIERELDKEKEPFKII